MIAAVYPYFLFSMLLGLSISSVACSITSTERTQFSHYFIDSFLYNIENKTVVHQFFFPTSSSPLFLYFFYFLQTCKPSKILCQFMSHFSCILFTTTSTSVYWSHCKKKEKKYMIKNRLMWFLLDFINFVDKNGKNVIQSTRIYNRISCNM